MEKNRIKIFHVDDDPFYLNYTKLIIDKFEQIEYLGNSLNAIDGLSEIKTLKPDLVILDVEMPGKDGKWLAEQLKSFNILIVFSTHYTKYALNAFNSYALHYLIKPILQKDLMEVIEKYNTFKNEIFKTQHLQISDFVNEPNKLLQYPKRVYINTHKEILILQLEKVLYIAAEGSYTKFHLIDGQVIISAKTLKIYSDLIENNPDFKKIHRSYIINKSLLVSISKKKLDIEFKFENDEILKMKSFHKLEFLNELC